MGDLVADDAPAGSETPGLGEGLIHALIAFAFGTVGRCFVGIGFAVTFCALLYCQGCSDGGHAERASIAAENAKARAGAKQEVDRVTGGNRDRVEGFDRD